jgi:hypothetical protein
VKRIAQWAFRAATALSLLICIASITLWIRSYIVRDFVEWFDGSRTPWTGGPVESSTVTLRSSGGGISFQSTFWHYGGGIAGLVDTGKRFLWLRFDRPKYPRYGLREPNYSPRPQIENLGFTLVLPTAAADESISFERTTCVILPIPVLTACFTILPVIALGSALKRRRDVRNDLCPHCGYDLRATPTRCPECGTATASATS